MGLAEMRQQNFRQSLPGRSQNIPDFSELGGPRLPLLTGGFGVAQERASLSGNFLQTAQVGQAVRLKLCQQQIKPRTPLCGAPI
jgi:hypothetical protein